MSNWLRKFAAARESSWYKVEQVAHCTRLRQVFSLGHFTEHTTARRRQTCRGTAGAC